MSEQNAEKTEPEFIPKYIGGVLQILLSRKFQKQVMWALGSIILALVVSAVIMLLSGYDPASAYYNLFVGAVLRPDRILYYATPLILTGLSVALAFKCGLFNIGAEGQLYMGSIAAAVVGFMISLPILIHPLACLIVGALAGFVWGFIPGLLKAYRGAHEVVTTMMLSYTAILFTQWLVTYPLKEQGPYAWISQTPRLYDTALLPNIYGPDLHWGLAVAIIAVFGVHFLINRTVLGYELRAVGQNQAAAEYGGINPKRNIAIALGLSGALSGLAGAEEIMGTYGRFTDNWSPNLGWDGITVAVLGNNNPWGVLAGAIFFGALRAGGNTMHQVAHVPIEMVSVIQGLVVLFVAAPRIVDWLANNGFENAILMRDEPATAIPQFLLSIITLVGGFLGFGLMTAQAAINPMLGIIMISAGILSFLAFSLTWPKNRNGPFIGLISSVVWFTAGAAGYMMAGMSVGIIGLTLGLSGILFSLLLLRTTRPSFLSKGGGN
ncbi:MAG: ABC transporter permease [Candidatus Thorarchaeota archaeon]